VVDYYISPIQQAARCMCHFLSINNAVVARNMKISIAAVLLLALTACVTEHRAVTDLSVSMMALNQGQPFVSKEFAERIALLVIEEKYPKDVFSVSGSARIVDKGDTWSVTFDSALTNAADKSALPLVGGKLVPKHLTISIRKVNAEIMAIT
jgi:hypothetical protein